MGWREDSRDVLRSTRKGEWAMRARALSVGMRVISFLSLSMSRFSTCGSSDDRWSPTAAGEGGAGRSE